MHVVDMVFHWARMDPDRPAIILPDLVTTYGGLADAVDSISNRIDQLGLDPNEPVATACASPALTLTVAFALMRSGFSVALFPLASARLRLQRPSPRPTDALCATMGVSRCAP